MQINEDFRSLNKWKSRLSVKNHTGQNINKYTKNKQNHNENN